MEMFLREVVSNFERNFIQVSDESARLISDLSLQKDKFRESYIRLISINAWRQQLIDEVASAKCSSFFREANNDIYSSHILARHGSWRVSLMSMRSFIENTFFGLFYIDHPVELRLWSEGGHKLGFSECLKYFECHPDFKGRAVAKRCLEDLKSEYAQLSRAVHGSSEAFRMSQDGKVYGVSSIDKAKLGSWLTRERAVLNAVNILLLAFFHKHLEGTAHSGLRKAISLSIKDSNIQPIREDYGVRLTECNTLLNQLTAS